MANTKPKNLSDKDVRDLFKQAARIQSDIDSDVDIVSELKELIRKEKGLTLAQRIALRKGTK